MASKRWVDIVAKVVGTHDPDELMMAEDVVKLLARQHRAFVRMVKRAYTYGPNFRGGMVPCEDGEWINAKDLLAALVKQGGGKK